MQKNSDVRNCVYVRIHTHSLCTLLSTWNWVHMHEHITPPTGILPSGINSKTIKIEWEGMVEVINMMGLENCTINYQKTPQKSDRKVEVQRVVAHQHNLARICHRSGVADITPFAPHCGSSCQGIIGASPWSWQGSATDFSTTWLLASQLPKYGNGHHCISALGQSVGWWGGLMATFSVDNHCSLDWR